MNEPMLAALPETSAQQENEKDLTRMDRRSTSSDASRAAAPDVAEGDRSTTPTQVRNRVAAALNMTHANILMLNRDGFIVSELPFRTWRRTWLKAVEAAIADVAGESTEPRFFESRTRASEAALKEAVGDRKVWCCRFHPTDWWHEIGCPHRPWSEEELRRGGFGHLVDALREPR